MGSESARKKLVSNVGMFCSHCSSTGYAPADGRCSKFSLNASMTVPIMPVVTVDGHAQQQQPVSVFFGKQSRFAEDSKL